MRESWQSMREEAESSARRLGGFELRPLQLEVLSKLAHGKHVFAGLPTGYGKSACYWLPAQAWSWKVWVISPLVSLIEDQSLSCQKLGVRALALKSSPLQSERKKQLDALEEGAWQVCFLSPERLQSWARSGYLQKLSRLALDPDLVVLDEMHCLEEWRFFRSSYGEIFERVKRWLGSDTLFLGLSASLSEKESRAWMEELCGSYEHIAGGLGRPNLRLRVLALEEDSERWLLLLEVLKNLQAPQCALVYCGTRRETDDVARWLRSTGTDAIAYHAGLPPEERAARSNAFRSGTLRVVCATSAFGMGIDYPHVSHVIHFSMPHDLESYWQEVGRAGRSGQEAIAVTFWRRSEISRLGRMTGDIRAKERFVALWRAWAGGSCRKRVVAQRLGVAQENCGVCDRCEEGGRPLPWWLKPEALVGEWLEEKIKMAAGRDASV